MSSIASLPLLDHNTVNAAQLNLTALANASAAFKAGKLPTSEQLQTAVQKLLASNFLQPELGSHYAGRVGGGKLSGPGREVVVRAREVLEAISNLAVKKNQDDKIQRFIYSASKSSVDADGQLETPDIPLPTSEEIEEAKDSLHSLLSALLASSQLRAILADGINLFRDLFADAADHVAQAAISTTKASKHAAKTARPTQDEKKEKKTGLEGKEFPDVHEIKKQTIRTAEDARDDAARALRNKAKQVKTYGDEQLPSDAKDALIERFKEIIDEIQASPEYEDAVSTIFGLVSKYASLTKEAVVDAASASTVGVEANKEAETAATLFRQIIESFTGPLDNLFKTADRVIKDLEGDDRIKDLFDEGHKFLDRAIHDPGYVTSSRASRRAEAIYDRAQDLIKSNAAWKADADAFVDAFNKALTKASNDRELTNLGNALDRFSLSSRKFGRRGLSLAEGKDVWGDLAQVFLPRLLGAVQSIPMPRVEFTSADVDLALDNVRFTSTSFIPDGAHFNSNVDYTVKKGYAAYASDFTTTTTLSFSGLRLQARDISYYINKKTGWLGLEDSGLLDIYVGSQNKDADDGLDVTLTVENAGDEDEESFFVLKKVQVAMTGFDICIHGSQHPLTNWLARGSLRGYLEVQLISALEEQIGELFKSSDSSLYAFQQRAIGAGRAASNPASYLEALFLPSSSSWSAVEVKSTGITKVGPRGEYILAIGVEEQLLPGKLTGLGWKGEDIASRKKKIDDVVDEGIEAYEGAQRTADGVQDDLTDEGERLKNVFAEREREEKRKNGWKSNAFDI